MTLGNIIFSEENQILPNVNLRARNDENVSDDQKKKLSEIYRFYIHMHYNISIFKERVDLENYKGN